MPRLLLLIEGQGSQWGTMARLGAFCFPGTGHLNPMIALAHRLQLRGHEVVLFGIADTAASVRAAGLKFYPIGAEDFPPGTLRALDERLAGLRGFSAFRFTLERVRRSMRMTLRDGPAAVQASGVEALLVDEAEFAGNVAEHLGLPWISVALIPPLLQDDRFPPFWLGWAAKQDRLSRLRNRVAIRLLLAVAAPIFNEVNRQRVAWGLEPHARPEQQLSPLGQITQMPKALEFDIPAPTPAGLHYTGPFVQARLRMPVDFPWEQLDGRPLIYASLGTLQNGSEAVFRIIAKACAALHVQLVISLGGGLDPASLQGLPGDPLVVRYAPQLELLKRAALVITHAGLNTVLEALCEGVPMVAVPLGNDQPGVAARLKAHRAGVVVSRYALTGRRLRHAISAVLSEPSYRAAARGLQEAISGIDGTDRAAALIENLLGALLNHE